MSAVSAVLDRLTSAPATSTPCTDATPLALAPADIPAKLYGYDVVHYIGAGAGSQLYAVSEPQTAQLYVLKHVKVKCERDERFVKQLETEHEVGRALKHPALRKSIDLKISRTLLRKPVEAALVLELFDGNPIEWVLPGTVPDVVEIFLQAADALAGLHASGFCHCDLKPGNILLGSDGRVKVIDFGQACKLGTKKDRIQGTPDYIAPEQVKCAACTARTDIYSFGATLYWALTRRKVPTLYTAGRGENSFVLEDRIPTPHEIRAAVPENLSRFVMECVSVNPNKRPQRMTEVSRRLDALHFVTSRNQHVA